MKGATAQSKPWAQSYHVAFFFLKLIFSSLLICAAVVVLVGLSCKTAPTTFYKRVSCKGQKVWREEGVSILNCKHLSLQLFLSLISGREELKHLWKHR